MSPPPELVAGARVVAHAVLDDECRPTGGCVHRRSGRVLGPFDGLAIAHYDGNVGFYLFYCDPDWNAVTDTYHDTVEGAMRQGEFEYEGLTWRWATPPP